MNAAMKRTLAASVVIGISVELSVWAFLYFVVGENTALLSRFMWIDRLQEPGMKAGEALASSVSGHFGWSAAPYFGTATAITVLITLWTWQCLFRSQVGDPGGAHTRNSRVVFEWFLCHASFR
jgi:hypothetical protein